MFVTGFSSNHFKEGLAFIRSFIGYVRKDFPDAPLVVFDIGLKSVENIEVS